MDERLARHLGDLDLQAKLDLAQHLVELGLPEPSLIWAAAACSLVNVLAEKRAADRPILSSSSASSAMRPCLALAPLGRVLPRPPAARSKRRCYRPSAARREGPERTGEREALSSLKLKPADGVRGAA